jgi:hypothetical protein
VLSHRDEADPVTFRLQDEDVSLADDAGTESLALVGQCLDSGCLQRAVGEFDEKTDDAFIVEGARPLGFGGDPAEFALEIRIIRRLILTAEDRRKQSLAERTARLTRAITRDLCPTGLNIGPGKGGLIGPAGVTHRLTTDRHGLPDGGDLSSPEGSHYS